MAPTTVADGDDGFDDQGAAAALVHEVDTLRRYNANLREEREELRRDREQTALLLLQSEQRYASLIAESEVIGSSRRRDVAAVDQNNESPMEPVPLRSEADEASVLERDRLRSLLAAVDARLGDREREAVQRELALHATIADLEAQLRGLRESTSWRVTRPFRVLTGWIKSRLSRVSPPAA